jgi:SAM-dependent methyltransferase
MRPDEYENIARMEETHWWYRGLRDAIRRTLERAPIDSPAGPRVLDAGCGTGGNLQLLSGLLRPSYLGGFDTSEQALALARTKVPEADLYQGDICDPELRAGELDLIVSLDVIYIPGAERARPGLKRLVDSLRPGGRVLLNLPAYDWLYSQHDVVIHTSERYTRGRVRELIESLGLTVELLTYRMCLLFPAVVLSRLPSLLRRTDEEKARSDVQETSPAVNGLLSGLLSFENRLVARGLPLPWGSSVFAVGRKP